MASKKNNSIEVELTGKQLWEMTYPEYVRLCISATIKNCKDEIRVLEQKNKVPSLKTRKKIEELNHYISAFRSLKNPDPPSLRKSYRKNIKSAVDGGEEVPEGILKSVRLWTYAEKLRQTRERSQRREETAFGMTGADHSFRNSLGVYIKRQDGKQLTTLQKDEIKNGLIEFFDVVEDVSDILYGGNIIIVHTNGKRLLNSKKSEGGFHPKFKSISIGVEPKDDGSPSRVLAHELFHALDHELGIRTGARVITEHKVGGRVVRSESTSYVAQLVQQNHIPDWYKLGVNSFVTNKKVTGRFLVDGEEILVPDLPMSLINLKYWVSPTEVFARVGEQMVLERLLKQANSAFWSVNKDIRGTLGYWEPDFFNKHIVPVYQEFLYETIMTIRRNMSDSEK